MEPENLSPAYNREHFIRRGLRLLSGTWEQVLLIGLLLAMVLMVASLLWPKPQTVISLKPYVAADMNLPVSDTLSPEVSEDSLSSTEKPASHKPRKRKHSTAARKKSEHPVVLNLNQAAYMQLQLLPGIGPKMAQRILEYRKASGGFKTIEQIMEVKGIGPKKFEKMKPYLRI